MFLNSSQIFSTKVFFDIFSGSVKMYVLKTAVELGIAEIIEKDCEVEKIGKCISSSYDRKNLCYFLDALASMGFCEKKTEVILTMKIQRPTF